MIKLRNAVLLAGVTAALVIASPEAFARGGRGGGGGGRGGGGGGGNMGGGGRPQQQQTENPTITADRQQVATLTASFNKANLDYMDALKKFNDEYMKQPEYADAQKAADEANKALEAARTACIERLKKDSAEYNAADKKWKAEQAKLSQMESKGITSPQRQAQAKAINDVAIIVDKLETDALSKDPVYQDAKKKLADAMAALKVEKDKLADASKADANLSTLKQAADTAKSTLADAQKKFQTDSATLR
jgi:hypothetical protein